MPEAVTVPSLTMMTSTVSKESLTRDTQIHTDTYAHDFGTTLKFAVAYDFVNKKERITVSWLIKHFRYYNCVANITDL